MIELTSYDGHRAGDKVSVMVARITTLGTVMGGTTIITLDTGKTVHVLEARDKVQRMVNLYLLTTK